MISLVNLMSWADTGMPVKPSNFFNSYKRATSSLKSAAVAQQLFTPAPSPPQLTLFCLGIVWKRPVKYLPLSCSGQL